MKTRHDGDCSYYAALVNGNPTDGICICGYAHQLQIQGDPQGHWEQLYSPEKRAVLYLKSASED
jgi:hypothetical protein